MAILKNLVINGSSRFLNKAYFQDVQIGGTATLSSLSLSGTLTVSGATTLNGVTTLKGATTINNTLNVTGTTTLKSMRADNGIELYHNTPYIDFHFGNSTADYTSRIIESSSGTLSIENNLSIASTISAPTGVISTLNSTNVNVTNNLRANHYDLQTVAQLGGSFYVSPTVKFPNSGTTLAVAKSGTTLTLTITDSSITSATMAGVVWTAGSGVKVSGTINGIVTGTMDGTISSINTSSHVLTLSVSGENSANVVAGTYTASQFKDLSVMLYTRKQDGTNKMINTASGAIASFTDGGNNVPVKQLVVDIEPVQDLHGYENPWPAGGGKNLFDESIADAPYYVKSDGTFTNRTTDTRSTAMIQVQAYNGSTLVNYVTASGTYPNRTIGTFTINSAVTQLRIKHNGSSFDLPINIPWTAQGTFTISCLVPHSDPTTVGGLVIKDIQVEKGSTATAYEPYSNICPISGYTQEVVTRCNRNFLDMENILPNGSYSEDGTVFSLTSSVGDRPTFQFAKEDGSYILTWDSVSGTMTGGRLQFYNANDQLVTTRYFSESVPYTVVGVCKVKFNYGNSGTVVMTKPMLRKSTDSDSTYQAPNTTIYTINLNGTRYGGTLDVGTGVMRIDRAMVDLGTLSWTYSVRYFYATTPYPVPVYNAYSAYANAICSTYRVEKFGTMYNNYSTVDKCFSINNGSPNDNVVRIRDTSYADAASFKTAMNGAQLVYELAEPFTVQLSRTEVRTLQGYNNIWSNTGNTNVIYESSQVDSTNNYNVGIWMNCYDQANSSSTIRVYNGSSRWPNVFLGNMTNADLPLVNGNAPYGYGLYSDNVFLRGIISATGGLIGNWTIGTTGMFYNSDAPGSTSITMIPGGTAASTTSIGGSSGSKSWIFTGKNLFGIDTDGKLYASSAEISGKITATSGSIGNFTLADGKLYSNNHSAWNTDSNGIYMNSDGISGGKKGIWWFWNDGSAKIGAMTLSAGGVLSVPAANITGTLTADQIAANAIVVGTRNLLCFTGTPVEATVNTTNFQTFNTYYTPEHVVISSLGAASGDSLTISFDWETSNQTTYGTFLLEFYGYKDSSNQDTYLTAATDRVSMSESAKSGHYSKTIVLDATKINTKRLLLRVDASNLKLKISHLMMSLSNREVEWTLSPYEAGGFNVTTNKLYSGTIGTDNSTYLSTANMTANIAGRGSASDWRFTVGSHFGVTNTGALYASSVDLSGKITATSGTIGGVTANSSYGLYTNSKTSATSTNTGFLISKNGAIYLGAYNSTNGACPFQVTSDGALTATSGKIGPWNVTTTSIYKAANTLGSTTSGAAYFGDLGLSIGNKFKVDASGVATLGESSGYHATMDTDSFDVLNGSTMLATFGTDSVIGNMSTRCVSINSDGFKFNSAGKTAFNVGIDNRSGSTASEATGYTFPSNPEVKYINSIPYYLLTTISSDRTVIEVDVYAEMADPEAESRIFFDWVVDNNKLYINCDEVDQKYDAAIDYVSYIYTTNTNTQAPYCIIGDNAYSSSNTAGTMSFAQGYKCLALGAYSTSVGQETLASGTSSFSLGKRSEAHGTYSFAGGALSTSKDFVSFAYGYKSNAWGKYSVAFGNQDLSTWIFEILITSCDTQYGDITFKITQRAETFEDYISTGSILVSTDNQYIFEDIVVTSGSGTSTITFSCVLYGGHFPAVNSVLHVRVNPPGSYGNGAMSVNACCASGISSTALGIGTAAAAGGSLAIGMYNIPESNVLFSIGNGTMLENHNAMTVDLLGNVVASGNIACTGISAPLFIEKSFQTGNLSVGANAAFSINFNQLSGYSIPNGYRAIAFSHISVNNNYLYFRWMNSVSSANGAIAVGRNTSASSQTFVLQVRIMFAQTSLFGT